MKKKIVINNEPENFIAVYTNEGTRMYYATHMYAQGLLNVIKYIKTLPQKDMIIKWKAGFDHGEYELDDEGIAKLEGFLGMY